MSAGTSTRAARSTCPPRTDAVAPSRPTLTPKAVSIRSVWSRVGAGSVTRVSPSAYSPASNSADFTWALATVSFRSTAVSPSTGCTCSGGLPSWLSMRAPIRESGSITRRMGRRDRLASPTIREAKRWPARMPHKSRIEVPELPQSRSPAGACRPCSPTPCTFTCPCSGPSIRTPIARKIWAVARASAPSRKPWTSVTPSASAPSMMARCEMDLSPGTRMSPRTCPPGATSYA